MKRRTKYVANRRTKTKREKKRHSLIVTFEKRQKERKTGIHQTDRQTELFVQKKLQAFKKLKQFLFSQQFQNFLTVLVPVHRFSVIVIERDSESRKNFLQCEFVHKRGREKNTERLRE
jgi:hypothetical protein